MIVQKLNSEKGNIGFNAEKLEFGDMFEEGVIDPTKVVRTALQNAASISSLLITTEAIVTELPEKEKDKMPMPGGHGGGGGEMY